MTRSRRSPLGRSRSMSGHSTRSADRNRSNKNNPDRIDGGDAEAVAHGAVGGRPAALRQDLVLAAEVHDVPDDQKIAGEIERLDEIELARDLVARPGRDRPVAIARADLRHLAEKRRLGFAVRHGIGGKAVTEIGHRELKPIGQFRRSRAIASGRSANSAAMASRACRYRSAFGASRRPARARSV